MAKFVVSYPDPAPSRPQPASPIELDPAFVFHQMYPGDSLGLTNAPKGMLLLRDTNGQFREFKIVQIRPYLDDKGNQKYYELSVFLAP